MKKGYLIILIILIVIIIALAGFYYFPKTDTASPAGETQGTNFVSQFFPLIKNIIAPKQEVTPPADISGFTPTTTEEKLETKFKKVSSVPIAGYGIFMKERFKEVSPVPEGTETTEVALPEQMSAPATELVPAVRYVDKIIGNIYQTFADKIDERRFLEVVVPGVKEAYFGENGKSVVMRYLKEDEKNIETFIGILPEESPGADSIIGNGIDGVFLPENISDISLSSDNSKMFYLFNSGNSAIGIISSALGDEKSQVFDSPFTEWLSWWPNPKIITLTTKPSAGVPGYMYEIDLNKKEFNKIMGDIKGLTTLANPSGELVLYADNNLFLRIYNVKTGQSDLTGFTTLPEKCAWGKISDNLYCAVPDFVNKGNYPDTWYMGEVSFSDSIWKIDVATGTASILTSFDETGDVVDAIKLSVDENEDYLFFINKKDSYLWKLDLK